MLGRSGLDKVTREGGTVTIGATVPVSELEELDEPLVSACEARRRRRDPRAGDRGRQPLRPARRGRAPRRPPGAADRAGGPRPLHGLGERTEPIEEFLAGGLKGRLVLDISYEDADRKAAYAAAWRPHTHHYSILAVAATKTGDELRIAATGGHYTPSAFRPQSRAARRVML